MSSARTKQQMESLMEQLASADRLLIVAAAGLSISESLPNNPYHSPKDFLLHYPGNGFYCFELFIRTLQPAPIYTFCKHDRSCK